MIQNKIMPELITAAEGVKLSLEYGTITSVDRCIAIREEYEKQTAPNSIRHDELLFLMAAIYDIARIQGIREERSRHNAADQKGGEQ